MHFEIEVLDDATRETQARAIEALERLRARQAYPPCWNCLRPTGSVDSDYAAGMILAARATVEGNSADDDLREIHSRLPAMDGTGAWVIDVGEIPPNDAPFDHAPDGPLDIESCIADHNDPRIVEILAEGTTPEYLERVRPRFWTVSVVADLLRSLQSHGMAAYMPELPGWVRPHMCDTCLSAVLSGQIRPGGRGATPIRDPVSPRLRFQIMQRDGFRCTYCGRTAATGAILHVDHVFPIAAGGVSDEDNLVTSCEECNFGKGANLLP